MSDDIELTDNGDLRERRSQGRLLRVQSLTRINCQETSNPRLFIKAKFNKIDRVSHMLFPGLFIAFNLIYWVVYLT